MFYKRVLYSSRKNIVSGIGQTVSNPDFFKTDDFSEPLLYSMSNNSLLPICIEVQLTYEDYCEA